MQVVTVLEFWYIPILFIFRLHCFVCLCWTPSASSGCLCVVLKGELRESVRMSLWGRGCVHRCPPVYVCVCVAIVVSMYHRPGAVYKRQTHDSSASDNQVRRESLSNTRLQLTASSTLLHEDEEFSSLGCFWTFCFSQVHNGSLWVTFTTIYL